MIGSWSIKTYSPLGVDNYKLFISENFSAHISEPRGGITFDDIIIENNNFELRGKTDIPLEASVVMTGKIQGSNIDGVVKIGEYCSVVFGGLKNE